MRHTLKSLIQADSSIEKRLKEMLASKFYATAKITFNNVTKSIYINLVSAEKLSPKELQAEVKKITGKQPLAQHDGTSADNFHSYSIDIE